LAEKDQLEALKKLNARARSAASGPHGALPTAEAPLHAASAADLQGNVGNAGLRQMIDSEAGQKQPKAGAHGSAKATTESELQKKAAHLESEATQHKSAAAREHKTAQNKRAAKPPKAHPVDAQTRTSKKPELHKGKAPPAHPEKKRPQLEHGHDHRPEHSAKLRSAPGRKNAAHAPTDESHSEATAAQKKASAGEARAEASHAKAQVARHDAGTGSKHTVKSAEHKEKKALKAETDAELAERHTLEKKKAAQAAVTAQATAKKEPHKTKTEAPEANAKQDKSKTKHASVEKKTNAKASAAHAKTEARTQEADHADEKLRKTEHEKHKAEAKSAAKSEAAVDVPSKAAAAKEAEISARAHEAATALAATKAEAEAKALQEEKAPENNTEEEISRAADLPHADGARVTLIGTYVPRPAPGGSQMLGHVSILVGNIEVRLGSDTRATAEMLRLSGERVAVTGTLDLKRASTEQATDPRKAEKPVLTRPGTVSKR
jgi:hypothetical protein